MGEKHINLGKYADEVHPDGGIGVYQLLECLRTEPENRCGHLGLHADRQTAVFGKDEGGSHQIARTKPAHLHLLARKRRHAAHEFAREHDVGISAGHSGQGIDISLGVVHHPMAHGRERQVELQFRHCGKQRARGQHV